MKNNKKGFTLIEVLIVVVIIGILASLILPRMLAQPERAVTAEALNFLGVIRRAQLASSQPTGAYQALASGPAGGPVAAGVTGQAWTAMGFQALPASSRFSYTCIAGNVDAGVAKCTATRNAIGGAARDQGTIRIDLDSGFVDACGGAVAASAYTINGTAGTATAACV